MDVARVELNYSVPENMAAWALQWSGEHAFQIRLRQPDREHDLVRDLEKIPGIQDALLVAYDGGTEV